VAFAHAQEAFLSTKDLDALTRARQSYRLSMSTRERRAFDDKYNLDNATGLSKDALLLQMQDKAEGEFKAAQRAFLTGDDSAALTAARSTYRRLLPAGYARDQFDDRWGLCECPVNVLLQGWFGVR
jgi:hypothetical protein